MKPAKLVWIIASAAVAVVVLVLMLKPAAAGVTDVDAAAVERLVGQPGVVLVDVRSAGEFQMGRIDGAINVPFNEIGAAAESWDRSATYVIYCATGQRSIPAVETMSAMGFEDIRHFTAGVQAWNQPLAQGAPADNSGTIATDGIPVMLEFFTDS
jgi:phage shock protein E